MGAKMALLVLTLAAALACTSAAGRALLAPVPAPAPAPGPGVSYTVPNWWGRRACSPQTGVPVSSGLTHAC